MVTPEQNLALISALRVEIAHLQSDVCSLRQDVKGVRRAHEESNKILLIEIGKLRDERKPFIVGLIGLLGSMLMAAFSYIWYSHL